jgi:1-acyl-sn-glycerol-3-phosphate acyltransferase
MNGVDAVWAVGRLTIEPLTRLFAPLRNLRLGPDSMEGGVVLAMNHFSWIDPPAFGAASPRTIHYLAKSEIHRHFGLGHLIRAFGHPLGAPRRVGPRAVRAMREIVRDGYALGLFVEGTRQKNGCPARRCPGRPWSRFRRTSRSCRPRSTGASSGRLATSIPFRSHGVNRCISRAFRARARATARARR